MTKTLLVSLEQETPFVSQWAWGSKSESQALRTELGGVVWKMKEGLQQSNCAMLTSLQRTGHTMVRQILSPWFLKPVLVPGLCLQPLPLADNCIEADTLEKGRASSWIWE